MIRTNRTITVGNKESVIDSPIALYRGDREVEIEFELNGNKYTFINNGNVIESMNASCGQLVITTPYGNPIFSDTSLCVDGKVSFLITSEMIDELHEVGIYSFQIRLYDEEKKSRVTIPPIHQGIEIREPIAAEDGTNIVDDAIVDYSLVTNDLTIEELDCFNGDRYIKTLWSRGDRITSNKLNKIENALYIINNNGVDNMDSIRTLNSLSDSQNYDIETLKKDLNIERNRINMLSSLEEGSTTGDAELLDGRIGYDSNNYKSIGESIRSQFKDVYTACSLISGSNNKYKYTWNDNGYVDDKTGEIVEYSGWKYTDFVLIDDNVDELYFSTSASTSLIYNAFYDENKEFIEYVNVGKNIVKVPKYAKYFRLSIKNEHNTSVFNINETLTDAINKNESFINDYMGINRNAYKLEWIDGGYINKYEEGSVTKSDYWKYTDYIAIVGKPEYLEATTTLTEDFDYNAFYDANKDFISKFSVEDSKIEIPKDAKYFRLSILHSKNTNIYNYVTPLIEKINSEEANDISKKVCEDTMDKYIGLKENAYDINWNIGGYVSDVDGEIILFKDWKYSDYTPISEKAEYLAVSTTLTESYGFNAFYDIDKNCIKLFKVNNEKIAIPKDAKYFRVSTPISKTTSIKNYITPVLDVINDEITTNKKMYIGKNYETKWNMGGYIDHLTGEVVNFSGWKYTNFISIDSDTEYIVMNSTLKDFDYYNAFYDTDKKFIRYIQANRGEVKVPNNAVYVRMSTREAENTEIVKVEKDNNCNTIVSLNKDVEPLIVQSHQGLGKPFGDTNKVLTFVHFTDIHAHSTLWNRMVEYVNYYEDYIDFSIHTGDYVNSNRVTAYYDLYNKGPQCVKPIYNVVGNHDTYLEDFSRGDKTTTKQLVFNWSDTWDVTFMDIEDSMTYYKDYPESKIRMIVLDYYYHMDEQCVWLANLLNEATNLGYHVVTFSHEFTHPIVNKLDTPFQTIDDYESQGGNMHSLSKFDKVIGDWIKGGGIHIANFVGHEHSDFVGYTENGVLNMCAQAATDHIYWTDANRVPGTKTHDCFNVVSVDTSTGMFKVVRVGNNYDHYLREKKSLVYDYINKKLLNR